MRAMVVGFGREVRACVFENYQKVPARGRPGPMAVRATSPSLWAGTYRTVDLWTAKFELYAGGGNNAPCYGRLYAHGSGILAHFMLICAHLDAFVTLTMSIIDSSIFSVSIIDSRMYYGAVR